MTGADNQPYDNLPPNADSVSKHSSLLLQGCDAKEAKLWLKAWAEQGAPTANRAERRKTAKAKRRAKK